MIANPTADIGSIRKKVESGERLTMEDGLLLYEPSVCLHEIGELANIVRERQNGNVAYYNINTHLNPTTVCIYRCTFCAFRADLRDERGYVMSDEQILERGHEAVSNGATEMHIVGGLHHQNLMNGMSTSCGSCTRRIRIFTSRPGRAWRSTGSSSYPRSQWPRF